ncbi:hypothetical protein P168DRAFT_291685 [Aspergillus campestris IBT 28561]|uniref:Inner kinetochore subunit AME1 domain-containing protein n=1 Tax=Aspergillus campestris (strain IBT 28561) TaxID=1392248 RepID=A0A2I1CY40_ASPC2|nr:uncharacterized protein P168DRAFT_291685 [Aspergillus campestris IBT 28561]PKY02538.1 hypothetical protein P168DRAFT_291685 [Aspergillus campestris IBT 28561]
MASNREERRQMRQRGAATRKIKEVDFGFSFGLAPPPEESSQPASQPANVDIASAPPPPLETTGAPQPTQPPLSPPGENTVPQQATSQRTPGGARNALPPRPSTFDLDANEAPELSRSAKRQRIEPPSRIPVAAASVNPAQTEQPTVQPLQNGDKSDAVPESRDEPKAQPLAADRILSPEQPAQEAPRATPPTAPQAPQEAPQELPKGAPTPAVPELPDNPASGQENQNERTTENNDKSRSPSSRNGSLRPNGTKSPPGDKTRSKRKRRSTSADEPPAQDVTKPDTAVETAQQTEQAPEPEKQTAGPETTSPKPQPAKRARGRPAAKDSRKKTTPPESPDESRDVSVGAKAPTPPRPVQTRGDLPTGDTQQTRTVDLPSENLQGSQNAQVNTEVPLPLRQRRSRKTPTTEDSQQTQASEDLQETQDAQVDAEAPVPPRQKRLRKTPTGDDARQTQAAETQAEKDMPATRKGSQREKRPDTRPGPRRSSSMPAHQEPESQTTSPAEGRPETTSPPARGRRARGKNSKSRDPTPEAPRTTKQRANKQLDTETPDDTEPNDTTKRGERQPPAKSHETLPAKRAGRPAKRTLQAAETTEAPPRIMKDKKRRREPEPELEAEPEPGSEQVQEAEAEPEAEPEPELPTEPEQPPPTKRRQGRPSSKKDTQPSAQPEEPAPEQPAEERPRPARKPRQPRGEAIPVTIHRLANVATLGGDTGSQGASDGEGSGDELSTRQKMKLPSRGGVNAADVLSQICRETLEKTIATLSTGIANEGNASRRSEWMHKRKAVEAYGSELEGRLLELSDMLDGNFTLGTQLKRAKREMIDMRSRLYHLRAQREDVALRMDAVRKKHSEEESANTTRSAINNSLHSLDLALERSQNRTADDEVNTPIHTGPSTAGLEFMLRSVAENVSSRAPGSQGGLLSQMRAFNARLEAAARKLES